MLKTYGYSIKDKIYPDRAADNDPFPEKVKVHFEKWKVIYETVSRTLRNIVSILIHFSKCLQMFSPFSVI